MKSISSFPLPFPLLFFFKLLALPRFAIFPAYFAVLFGFSSTFYFPPPCRGSSSLFPSLPPLTPIDLCGSSGRIDLAPLSPLPLVSDPSAFVVPPTFVFTPSSRSLAQKALPMAANSSLHFPASTPLAFFPFLNRILGSLLLSFCARITKSL